ncbi:MAG: RHS repeat-associated core domain-containing protein, partial [Pyrinomonadaceae bacterium]
MTDNGGSVISRHDYLPFGEEIGAGVGSRTTGKLFSQYDNVRQKYAGMETDTATGMAHTLWRKQDNWSGRWTSPDPYGGSMTTANPQSFNRYVYSDNDPLNKVDPSGLVPNDYHGAQDGWGQVGGYMFDPTQCDPNGRKRSNSAARLGIMSNLHGNRVNRT